MSNATIVAAVLLFHGSDDAIASERPSSQSPRVEIRIPGVPSNPSPPGDPADAKIVGAAEFASLPQEERRRIMSAWSSVGLADVGNDVLLLLNAGLRDSDAQVRSHALTALVDLESHVNFRRTFKRPLVTDHTTHLPLRDSVIAMVRDPSPNIRWGAVTALMQFDPADYSMTETVVLPLWRSEANGRVRAQMIRALGVAAAAGSPQSSAAIADALKAQDAATQLAATEVTRRTRRPDLIESLIQLLSANHPSVRAAAARALRAYGPDMKVHKRVFEERFESEIDGDVRRAIRELLDSLPRGPG